ncbi:MAG: hypothetical protein ABH872_02180 [Candidatus Omnitrophota bacterium]
MKKITINLLPSGTTADNKIILILKKYIAFIFLGLTVLICADCLLFAYNAFGQLTQKSLEKKLKTLTPQAKEGAVLKKDLEALKIERGQYKNLVPSGGFSSMILADIASSVPKNIWLQNIQFDGNRLGIFGYVVQWKEDPLVSVDKLIKELSSRNYLSQSFPYINLENSRKSTVNNVDVVDFRIECGKR